MILILFPGFALAETDEEDEGTPIRFEYNLEGSFESLQFIKNREAHSINDQETIELNASLDFDNQKNLKLHLEPWFRFDFRDNDRTRYIPNDAYLLYYKPRYSLYAGQRTFTWGVSNSFNPTDVLNRTDKEDNYYRPDKLGELVVGGKLMFNQVGPFTDVTIEGTIFPLFLKSPLPENDTRFAIAGTQNGIPFRRTEFQDTHDNYFESIAGALRISGTLNWLDLALHYYQGPDHDPTYYLALDTRGALRLVPYYYNISMFGLNAEAAIGKFIFHAEAAYKITEFNEPKLHEIPIFRSNAIPGNYLQVVPGVDYTFSNVLGDGDLTLTLEYMHEFGEDAPLREFRPFKNDLFLGARWNLNNKLLTQVEAGIAKDLKNEEMLFIFDASTRVYKNFRAGVHGVIVNQDRDPQEPLSFFDNNTYVAAKVSYAWGGDKELKKKKKREQKKSSPPKEKSKKHETKPLAEPKTNTELPSVDNSSSEIPVSTGEQLPSTGERPLAPTRNENDFEVESSYDPANLPKKS